MDDTTIYIYWRRGTELKLWRKVLPHDDPAHPRAKFRCESGSDPSYTTLECSTMEEALALVTSNLCAFIFLAHGDVDSLMFSREEL